MKSRPPRLLERVIALLIPPAYREHVLGDLYERYTKLWRYIVDAARTVPLVLLSHIRRNTLRMLFRRSRHRQGSPISGGTWMLANVFEKNTRRANLSLLIVVAFIAFLGCWRATIGQPASGRIAGGLILALALYVLYQLYKKGWTTATPGETYRDQLARRRDALLGIWSWFLGPILAAMLAFAWSFPLADLSRPKLWVNVAPFMTLACVWSWMMWNLARRAARRLQKEIDDLDKAS